LRTLEKRVVAAENALSTASAGLERLNPLVHELALVRASLARLASRRDGRASGWYSIGEAERLLLLYLTDALSLSPSGRAVQQRELEAQPTDETPEGGWSHEALLAAAGISASDGPRTRNVHGERLSWSAWAVAIVNRCRVARRQVLLGWPVGRICSVHCDAYQGSGQRCCSCALSRTSSFPRSRTVWA
jgi:hypothetical protein